jgi:RimJ/RimL family protein N-acetyltransferase
MDRALVGQGDCLLFAAAQVPKKEPTTAPSCATGEPMLCGSRVRARALEREDLVDIVRWFNDPALRALLSRSSPLSMAEEERWFEALLKSTTEVIFVIDTMPTPRLPARRIGCCGLHRIDWRNRGCVVGILLGESTDRGQGLGSEAMRLLVDHAVFDLGLQRVELEVYADNEPARRCYERLGFVVEGVRRQATFKGGAFKDNVVMSVLAHEWASSKPPATGDASPAGGRGRPRRR